MDSKYIYDINPTRPSGFVGRVYLKSIRITCAVQYGFVTEVDARSWAEAKIAEIERIEAAQDELYPKLRLP